MKRINGTIFYSLREISIILNKDYQTILRYFTVSQKLRDNGNEELLPIATQIGKGHYYSEGDVRHIKTIVRSFKRGMFKDFSKNRTTYQKLKEENEKLKNKIKELETEVR